MTEKGLGYCGSLNAASSSQRAASLFSVSFTVRRSRRADSLNPLISTKLTCP
jgi:hypothetical protein